MGVRGRAGRGLHRRGLLCCTSELIATTGTVTALAVTYLIPVFGVTWGAKYSLMDGCLPARSPAGLLVLAGVALTTRAAAVARVQIAAESIHHRSEGSR